MTGMDGFGTILARGNGDIDPGPETFTALAGISSITGPGISREVLDVTAHDSPDGYREKLGGIKDPGEVSVEVNYDPSVHDVWVDDLDDVAPRNYTLTFPDGTEWAFAAILTSFEPSAPFDDKATASASFAVTGKPTITPAA
jgi:predicted secreted protein